MPGELTAKQTTAFAKFHTNLSKLVEDAKAEGFSKSVALMAEFQTIMKTRQEEGGADLHSSFWEIESELGKSATALQRGQPDDGEAAAAMKDLSGRMTALSGDLESLRESYFNDSSSRAIG